MARKKDEPGLQNSAGLIRNLDVDERKNIQIPPWFVIALPFILAAVVVLIVLIVRWITG